MEFDVAKSILENIVLPCKFDVKSCMWGMRYLSTWCTIFCNIMFNAFNDNECNAKEGTESGNSKCHFKRYIIT